MADILSRCSQRYLNKLWLKLNDNLFRTEKFKFSGTVKIVSFVINVFLCKLSAKLSLSIKQKIRNTFYMTSFVKVHYRKLINIRINFFFTNFVLSICYQFQGVSTFYCISLSIRVCGYVGIQIVVISTVYASVFIVMFIKNQSNFFICLLVCFFSFLSLILFV